MKVPDHLTWDPLPLVLIIYITKNVIIHHSIMRLIYMELILSTIIIVIECSKIGNGRAGFAAGLNNVEETNN